MKSWVRYLAPVVAILGLVFFRLARHDPRESVSGDVENGRAPDVRPPQQVDDAGDVSASDSAPMAATSSEPSLRLSDARRSYWLLLFDDLPVELRLTENEKEEFLKIALESFAKLEEIEEGRITPTSPIDAESVAFMIEPFYHETGGTVEFEFYKKFESLIGVDRFERIDPVLGDAIDAKFHYWGLYKTSYYIERVKNAGTYRIDRIYSVVNDEALPDAGPYSRNLFYPHTTSISTVDTLKEQNLAVLKKIWDGVP